MSCTSDPTSGCDNSEIVGAIENCCSQTNTNLTSIISKLTAINTQQTDCCASITSKLDTVIDLLSIIANK